MMRNLLLFLLSMLFMYAAFFSWYMIGGDYWGWANIPTVVLCTLVSIVHAWLLVVNLFGVNNEKK